MAPFQEASAEQVCQNFAVIKAQVQAIVGGENSPAQEVQASAIPQKELVEQPTQNPQDFANVEKASPDKSPSTPHQEEGDDPNE